MSQISLSDALDLIHKLLTERIPLRAFFVTARGIQVALPGFVDHLAKGELAISVSGPPLKNSEGWINIPLADRPTLAWYGDIRELPDDLRFPRETGGDSVLRFDFADTGDTLAIFFTL
jgi:hypothetical protein